MAESILGQDTEQYEVCSPEFNICICAKTTLIAPEMYIFIKKRNNNSDSVYEDFASFATRRFHWSRKIKMIGGACIIEVTVISNS